MIRKLVGLAREETYGLHGRWLLARLLLAPFPFYVGSRVRVKVLRLLGFQIGEGSSMWGTPKIIGSSPLHKKWVVGHHCLFNVECFLDLSGPITVGSQVVFGPQVALITGAHEIGDASHRLGLLKPEPITIGDGCWLGARATVLPGVTIGSGSVVAAGAVVTKNVPPNTLVAGVPAKIVRYLEADSQDSQLAAEIFSGVGT